jgi:hypothetical protein
MRRRRRRATSPAARRATRCARSRPAHLDQLGELADALDNGNTQIVNKIVQNYFSKATGSPNVTNFDAIKAIVGKRWSRPSWRAAAVSASAKKRRRSSQARAHRRS